MTYSSKRWLLVALLLLSNIIVWLTAIACFRHSIALLGTALLAYSLGLRHALDADHIAAIDNITRKLMNDGKQPIGVGLNFSLGHSTIVVIGSLVIAATAAGIQQTAESVQSAASLLITVGNFGSIAILFALAFVNMKGLPNLLRNHRSPPLQSQTNPTSPEAPASGLLGRLTRPLLGYIRSGWQMYPLGILFGLGFDTATEVGLLNVSAAQASLGISLWEVSLFPLLFAVAMSTIDSADNLLMLKVYSSKEGVRNLSGGYRILTTGVSVITAASVGVIELLDQVRDHLGLTGWWWSMVGTLTSHLPMLGAIIVFTFAMIWATSLLTARSQRLYRRSVPTLLHGSTHRQD